MELSRTEYPALLASLQPEQAIGVLHDRVALIDSVNRSVADWLQERRKIEEAYSANLRKLARRPQQDGAVALGIFQMPWQRIVSSVENLAQSHETLAQKIETDVEAPLRQWTTNNREMQALSTTQANLTAIAKDLNNAQRKAEKLNAKGSRKADDASTTVDDAARQWESQAPYVFEQLQAVDETRINHLRDVLTQFQTHEVDQVERNRTSAESCLNALLNLETADEIKTFAARIGGQQGARARRRSSTGASARPQSSSLAVPPTPPPPRRTTEDNYSQRTSSSAGQDRLAPLPEPQQKGKLKGLKRFGTVLSRKKSDPPTTLQTPMEKRKDRTRSFAPFRRTESSRSFQDLEETGRDLTPTISEEPSGRALARETATYEPPPREQLVDAQPVMPFVNGASELQAGTSPTAETMGLQPGLLDTPNPPQQVSQATLPLESKPVAEEPVSIPEDPVSSAQREAAASSPEADEMARNLTIRDQPIREDESEAQRAMNNMANQLRMQAQTSGVNRVQGSVRGRRDVRNTMFVPSVTDRPSTPGSSSTAFSGAGVAATAAIAAPAATLATFDTPAAPSTPDLASPMKRSLPPGTIPEEQGLGSDTTSIHSSHSLAGHPLHQETHSPGLNASVVETVNTWFTETGVSKSFVVGEVALAYNAQVGAQTPDHETIRLQNFQMLEKVAANPMFVTRTKSADTVSEDQAGSYTVSLSSIQRSTPTVGLKYQLLVNEVNLAEYSPILIRPAWQILEGQVSVIVLYSSNPAFSTEPTVLKNVAISVNLDISGMDTGKPTAAMMAPTQGASFRRKAGAVVWRFNELNVKPEQERLLVRFQTQGGLAKKSGVEVKFELPGRVASALGVERLSSEAKVKEAADPFADEGESARGSGEAMRERAWEECPTRKCLVSGRYSAA